MLILLLLLLFLCCRLLLGLLLAVDCLGGSVRTAEFRSVSLLEAAFLFTTLCYPPMYLIAPAPPSVSYLLKALVVTSSLINVGRCRHGTPVLCGLIW